jgi:hypothetical protein
MITCKSFWIIIQIKWEHLCEIPGRDMHNEI